MKRWSKLKREIYKLLDPALDLKIHCRVTRQPTQWTVKSLPGYWITLEKEVIFDFSSNFKDTDEGQQYPYGGYKKEGVTVCAVSEISDIIRRYIDTPKDELISFTDKYALSDILKASDRRLGKEKLLNANLSQQAKKVLERRFAKLLESIH